MYYGVYCTVWGLVELGVRGGIRPNHQNNPRTNQNHCPNTPCYTPKFVDSTGDRQYSLPAVEAKKSSQKAMKVEETFRLFKRSKRMNHIYRLRYILVVLLLGLVVVACGGGDEAPEGQAPQQGAAPQVVVEQVEVVSEPLVAQNAAQQALIDQAAATNGGATSGAAADASAPAGDAAMAEGDLKTIVVWAEPWTARHMIENPDKDGQYGLKLKELFEAQNPGFTVSIEDHSWDNELRQNLMTALMGGTAPDVVVSENFFKQYVEMGAIIPLDPYIADIKDDLIPGTYAAAEVDGSLYGISQFTGVFGFERNCDVITAAGLDCTNAPATWDELLAQAQAVNNSGVANGFTLQGPIGDSVGSVFRVAVLLAQANAELCQNDCSFPFFNDPNAVPVYEFLREMNKLTPPGLTFEPDEGKVYSQLFEGKSAFQIAGSWHPNWAAGAGCANCQYSGVPIPPGGQAASIIVGNGIYAVTAQSQYPEQAANFVKLLAAPEPQELIYSAMGRLPTTKSGLNALRPNVTPAEQAYIDELLNNPDLRILPSWPKNPQQVWTIYNEMLTQILTSDRPVNEIMNEYQAQAELAVR